MGSTLDLSDTEEIGLGLEQAQQSQQSQADLFTRALLIPAVLSGTCVCGARTYSGQAATSRLYHKVFAKSTCRFG